MNRQPFGIPPRWWQPKMSRFWVRLTRGYRRRALRRIQHIDSIECYNIEAVVEATRQGAGVLITPNHSAHYDSAALYAAADRVDLPLYFMSAWQVFHLSTRFESWLMQKIGCFSVDRESNDRQAFKQAVRILQQERHPLVVFAEGDIYHTTDIVTSFREGAAAMASSAAKRSQRQILAVPCGIKFWYLDDPTSQLHAAIDQLEDRLYLRSRSDSSLADRIYRLAEAALALKELDYLEHTRTGSLRDRVQYLLEEVLQRLEARHTTGNQHSAKVETPPARVKVLRQIIIRKLQEESDKGQSARTSRQLEQDMEDLFFAIQLYSYPGNYLSQSPSIERLAETVDKFEEDILQLHLPSVRGRRRVVIQFGDPIEVGLPHRSRDGIATLTHRLQADVQQIIEDLNARGR